LWIRYYGNFLECPNCEEVFAEDIVKEAKVPCTKSTCTKSTCTKSTCTKSTCSHTWEAREYSSLTPGYIDETIHFCSKCGTPYPTYLAEQNIDLRATLEERIKAFKEIIEPTLNYYARQGVCYKPIKMYGHQPNGEFECVYGMEASHALERYRKSTRT